MRAFLFLITVIFTFSANGNAPVIETSTGPIEGLVEKETLSFKGIPYAEPPVGKLRWQPTLPAQPWREVRSAKKFGAACIQPGFRRGGKVFGSEDCLTLNLWRPKRMSLAPIPVVVFVHGGANTVGSASDVIGETQIYEGANLSSLANAIVITVQYRLGAFGFLAHNELRGNYALLDIIEALKWVQVNAARFGGDEHNITLMGESAGAMNALAVYASPLSKGLIQKLILQSTFVPDVPRNIAQAQGDRVMSLLGCDENERRFECLMQLSAEQVIERTTPDPNKLEYYTAVVDGYILPETVADLIAKNKVESIPVLIGSNRDEMRTLAESMAEKIKSRAQLEAFLSKQFGAPNAEKILAQYPLSRLTIPQLKFEEIMADALLHCPTRNFTRAFQKTNKNTWRYLFARRLDHPLYWLLGAGHALELPFVLSNHLSRMTNREKELSKTMVGYWGEFFRSGNPNGDSRKPWPRSAHDEYLYIDLEQEARFAYRNDECDFWDTLNLQQ